MTRGVAALAAEPVGAVDDDRLVESDFVRPLAGSSARGMFSAPGRWARSKWAHLPGAARCLGASRPARRPRSCVRPSARWRFADRTLAGDALQVQLHVQQHLAPDDPLDRWAGADAERAPIERPLQMEQQSPR